MPQTYIEQLLQRNDEWVKANLAQDPEFYERHSQGQQPKVLWIGCSDSRVSPEEITHTGKGELFVHRNIANLVGHSDLNLLSALEYAVGVLEVQHIVVCGHYGCGGVKAALKPPTQSIIDHWIRPIKDTVRFYEEELAQIPDEIAKTNRLIELNVLEQVSHLGNMELIQSHWAKRKMPYLHGWVYDLHSGYLKKLADMIHDQAGLKQICKFERW